MPDRPVKDPVLFKLERSQASARKLATAAARDVVALLTSGTIEGEKMNDLRDAAEELLQRVHEMNAYGNSIRSYLLP